MKKYLLYAYVIAFAIQCSKGGSDVNNPVQPDEIIAPIVTNIQLSDVSNNGNGSDLEIFFSKVTDESLLKEYRLFVVKSSQSNSFDLATAEGLPAGFYNDITPNGSNKKITLNETSEDVDGDLIVESVEYVVFVLSVADGTNATINSISKPSAGITLEEILVNAPKVPGNILVNDIANNGNGADFEVFFKKVSDETLISEYRLYVVKANEVSTFDLQIAESISAENYLSIEPVGDNILLKLTSNSTDIDGQLLNEAVEYVVFVVTIVDGINATGQNALSNPSQSIMLDQSSIKITYIGNDGVHITDGTKSVIIDALPGNLTGWNPLANGLQAQIEQGNYPFHNIALAMVTHNHGDHISSSSMTSFLSNNSSATLLAPSQVRSNISGSAGQISNITLTLDEQTEIVENDIPIKIMRIRHFTPQDGTDFSSIESFAYLFELGGKKILHIGDGDLSSVNFGNLDLASEGIDIVLIPTFNFSSQLTTPKKDILLTKIAPANIIGLHLFSTTPTSDVTNLYPDAVVFNSSLQVVKY